MDSELKELISKYRFDRNIRHYSNKYYFNNQRVFGSINSNDDMEKAKNSLINSINYYKKIYPLHSDDIKYIEERLGLYELTLSKIIQCIDNPYCNFNYTAKELQELIDDISKYDGMIGELRMRKACQD